MNATRNMKRDETLTIFLSPAKLFAAFEKALGSKSPGRPTINQRTPTAVSRNADGVIGKG